MKDINYDGKYGKIIQIQVSRGADDRPFLTALTDTGCILIAENMWGFNGWMVMWDPEEAGTANKFIK